MKLVRLLEQLLLLAGVVLFGTFIVTLMIEAIRRQG